MLRLAVAVWLGLSVLALPAVAAADAASPWTPGPGASGDDTYTGFIDTPAPNATVLPSGLLTIQGWVVDRTAVGWSGIDDVEVYSGLQDQGGTLLVRATVNQRRDDVAAALGNAYWANAGFSAAFDSANLAVGTNILTLYAHTPDKGWWYRQLSVNMAAAPARAYADDPLLIIREADPSLDLPQSTSTLTLTGYAIDRNLPQGIQLGAGGSGVSQVQFYLDGPRTTGNGAGTFLGNATLGQKNREATGFGERFLMSGWQMNLHPTDFSVDRHELFIYASSAYWPSETLVVLPFTLR